MANKFSKLNLGNAIASGSGRAWKKLSTYVPPAAVEGALTFSSPSSFTLNIVDNTKYWDGMIEYSIDNATWNEWDGTTTLSADEGLLYMRGTGNTYITGSSASSSKTCWVLTGSVISCIGNIENLLDYATVANGEHPVMTIRCYAYMFCGCTGLITAPELPATTLAPYCYSSMFSYCSNLTTAPELPATTLADRCYTSMFYGCTDLTSAPELPATTLASYCYGGMFEGCTGLITAPELPATTLADNCYRGMFGYCSSLTTAPELPATTLAEGCYYGMFIDCTSLTTAPELTATTLAENCYEYMFCGCTSLTTAPELPATTLTDYCYSHMFHGCTGLTTIPALPATNLAEDCYFCMFIDCTSLTTAPELTATTLADRCYEGMFSGCSSLTTAPELPATTLTDHCYNAMFSRCESLTTAPELPATTLAEDCYENMFYNCASLTTAPELPATTLADRCYYGMFEGCSSLTTAPELPATTLTNYCYYHMFEGCTSLITVPGLPATTLAGRCYLGMFTGCTSLTSAPQLPATTLAYYCYNNMFKGCTSLTTAPELPATTLVWNCYSYMFQGCTALTTVPELPASTLAKECYLHMFYNCTSLVTVPILPATELISGSTGSPYSYGCCQEMFEGCTSLKLATEQTEEYTTTYRIHGTMTEGDIHPLTDMFAATGGTFTGTPEINTIYYLHSSNSVISTNAPAPILSLNRDTLTITDSSGLATLFDILIDGQVIATISNNTLDLSTFSLTDGVHVISAIAKADGYFDSVESKAAYYALGVGDYFTFSSPSAFTLNTIDNTKYWDGILEYSTDTSTWNEWDGTTTLSADSGLLYMRGTGNTYITGSTASTAKARWVLTGSDISCIGNIENLLYYAMVVAGLHPPMAESCYEYMFSNCTSLTTAPELPATTLADHCYDHMFYSCTRLTTAPELPATTLASYCYRHMFYNCTSLTTAPELPATTLAEGCYNDMFSSCTSLTTAPELPATTLADKCYGGMFSYCSSLTTAPELPATTLARYCYGGMFEGCTGLITAPELPATTLADNCYRGMFYGCTSLITIPELPATALTYKCYCTMFYGCTSLKLSTEQTDEYTIAYRIPTSGEGIIPEDATDALTDMFTSTGGTFTGTPEINTTYYLHSSNSTVLPPIGTSLEDCTWEQISAISAAGKGEEYFKVGDTKSVYLSGTVGTLALDTTLYVYIIGFSHNGSEGITFGTFKTADGVDVGLVDNIYNTNSTDGTKYFNMNHWGNHNYGGWAASDIRYDILGSTDVAPSNYGSARTTSDVGYDATSTCATNPVEGTLMAALPMALRAVMKPMTLYTDNTGNESNIEANVTATVDYLPLLAEYEIFGTRTNANQYEKNKQAQYEYFVNGNSKIKYKHTDMSSSVYWWERSARYRYSGTFCYVSSNGSASYHYANTSNGLAPAFLV